MCEDKLPPAGWEEDIEADFIYTEYHVNLDNINPDTVTITHSNTEYKIEIQDGKPVVVPDE